MINKKNLWFLTLFSLVLVLSIYYVTMPSELLLTGTNIDNNNGLKDNSSVVVEESNILEALRVESNYQLEEEMKILKQTLTDLNVTVEEKNLAFEELKSLNLQKGIEQSLEAKIKNNYQVESFIKIDNDQVRVVVSKKEHDAELANNIMRTIQEEFPSKMYISVKFQG